jgi:hypothetical protein
MYQVLFRAQVPFGRLNGRVAEEQLDLLQLASRCSTQLRAGPTGVMRRDTGESDRLRILLEHLPNDFLSQVFAPSAIGPVYWSEQVAVCQSGRRSPCVNRDLRPCWHWDCSDASVLADEIHDAPATVPLLHVRKGERRDL